MLINGLVFSFARLLVCWCCCCPVFFFIDLLTFEELSQATVFRFFFFLDIFLVLIVRLWRETQRARERENIINWFIYLIICCFLEMQLSCLFLLTTFFSVGVSTVNFFLSPSHNSYLTKWWFTVQKIHCVIFLNGATFEIFTVVVINQSDKKKNQVFSLIFSNSARLNITRSCFVFFFRIFYDALGPKSRIIWCDMTNFIFWQMFFFLLLLEFNLKFSFVLFSCFIFI